MKLKTFLFAVLTVLFFLTPLAHSKDLPETVEIRDLLDHSERYDGKRVIVFGTLRGLPVRKSRSGIPLYEFEVRDPKDTSSEHSGITIVLNDDSNTDKKFKVDENVIVQGVFHSNLFQGGLPFYSAILVEILSKDVGASK